MRSSLTNLTFNKNATKCCRDIFLFTSYVALFFPGRQESSLPARPGTPSFIIGNTLIHNREYPHSYNSLIK